MPKAPFVTFAGIFRPRSRHSEPETGSDGVRSGSDRGAVRRGQVSIGRPATKSTNDAHPVDGYLGNVTSKMGTGSANPFRLRTPFDSNPINFPRRDRERRSKLRCHLSKQPHTAVRRVAPTFRTSHRPRSLALQR